MRRLARFSGLSHGLVSDLINGSKGKKPRPKTVRAMKRIASLMGVTYDAMWGPGSLDEVVE